ncbi:uncharacterized protein PV09_04030 [Verruconis gallopava]|uniref:DH domain-containing protein n=1 Tax=Verruconis gallopava TaxID=253628 RepID=A0A0D2AD37_9PEZI|nr:uncharacterized protein PV09_04030 [Verruconis gallopava]KIW04848.1 hypothetical protein PV09_04030 [Verruconis gallopava]
MPSPQPNVKNFSLAKANPYETTSVRDKIRKWQTAGGGVLEQPEEAATADQDAKSEKKSEKSGSSSSSNTQSGKSRASPSAHTRSKSESHVEVDDPPRIQSSEPDQPKTPSQLSKSSDKQTSSEPPKPRVVERKPNGITANKLDADVRKAIAPKKRIVSDGHWRRKHVDPNAPVSPPKSSPTKKEQYAWVRPPLLARPSVNDESPPSPPKPKRDREPMRIYTGKGTTKPIAAQIHSQLSMRPKESVPMRPKSPTTPRPRRPSTLERTPELYDSEDDSPRKPKAQSNQKQSSLGPSKLSDDDFTSSEEKTRTRLSKSRKSGSEGLTSETPRRRRSLSLGANANHTTRRPSLQRKVDHHESADEGRRRPQKQQRRWSLSEESKSSYESFSPPRPPRELNNFDEDAEKRRSNFRAEFAQFKPSRLKRRSHRKPAMRQTSHSPEPIKRRNETIAEPIPPQRQTSQRIEAWLTETPDPFDENKKANSRRAFSFETNGRGTATDSTIETETTITETTITEVTESTLTDMTESTMAPNRMSRKYGGDRKSSNSKLASNRHIRAKSEPSDYLDPQIEVEYSSTTSVPTLKRRGAKYGTSSPSSKVRSKPPATESSYTESCITESDVTESVVSSSIDPRDFSKPGENQSLNVARRLFPSTGKRLSTIASVETLATKSQDLSNNAPEAVHQKPEDSKASLVVKSAPAEDVITALPNFTNGSVVSAAHSRSSLRRKKTATHADLMTVLSMPASRSKSIVSARSIRTHRSRLETATLEDLMRELASDEMKYMRELRTLADDVIPILLKCVLSKSEEAVAAGLFKDRPVSEKDAISEASRVIHDLSVSIQRLKSLHMRIPKENHFSLLIWAQSAQSVYDRYIKTWRLGFQGIIVNVQQEESTASAVSAPTSDNGSGLGMARNEEGDIIDANGERVDVAYLLRRPLVRLKFLHKTLKGINIKKPSEQAGVLAKKFEALVEMARKRVDDEKARMEDDAAAHIDATRARDPKSLAPLAGVKIDATRSVRGRDIFDMHLPHSSGQTMDCRVELIIRDDAPGRGQSGDVLICEVDESGRWLLFPPVELKRISSRAGDEPGQIVVMIRGVSSSHEEWDEVFALTTDDEEIRFEWIQWLGLVPVPPPLGINKTFKDQEARPTSSHASSSLVSSRTESTAPLKSRTPSPREIEIPIGERATSGAKRWSKEITSPRMDGSDISSFLSSLDSERATLFEKRAQNSDTGSYTSVSSRAESDVRTDITPPSEPKHSSSRHSTPRNLNEAMEMAGSGSPTLKRTRAKRYRSSPEKILGKHAAKETTKITVSGQHEPLATRPKQTKSIKKASRSDDYSVWIPNSEPKDDSESDVSDEDSFTSTYLSGHMPLHHRTSSVPSLKLPSVRKMRSSKPEDEYMSGALQPEPTVKTPTKPATLAKEPLSAPPKLERLSESPAKPAAVSLAVDTPPPPPPHRTPSSSQVKLPPAPQFTPIPQVKRRSSSPLKHEYRPSSPSSESSYTEDEDSASEYSQDSLSSESEDDLEDDDVASTFVSSVVSPREPEKPSDLYSLPNGTIKPSESASQAPYRKVPHTVSGDAKPAKCVASIFTWSEKGHWELLHPNDCIVMITPGLIAAYPLNTSHAPDSVPEERPLVAQELTPLVPLRRGTLLDITIRSPPTPASRLTPGSNIMFRSRSSDECEMLYNLINRSRINNPTYIALQNARPPVSDGWAAAMDRQNSQRGNGGSGGWLSRSRSYRASSRAQSTAGNTESSIGTISSVITAMKRFSGAGVILDKARSRMSISRDGSDSLGSGGSGTRSPPQFVADQTLLSGGAGISNAKIRLYVLQSKNKWVDLGSARLSILPKEEGAVIAAPLMLHTGQEKRIAITKKKTAECLLDVTLPEPCFERWARTGIGVSVWVDVKGNGGEGIPETGGVTEKRVVKYMIQLKSERECAYTFSLLGKLRY